MNTAETDLIFEAYAKTFNENSDRYDESHKRPSISERLKTLMYIHRDAIKKSEPTVRNAKYDGPSLWQALEAIQDDISNAGDRGDFLADVQDVWNRLQLLLIGTHGGTLQHLGLAQPLKLLANEMMDIKKEFGSSEEDNEEKDNESSEGAVNLLEQLKAEVPELEDKINQVLEKVFDAVDILKQESYVNDPQLVKAHDSLIEGNF